MSKFNFGPFDHNGMGSRSYMDVESGDIYVVQDSGVIIRHGK